MKRPFCSISRLAFLALAAVLGTVSALGAQAQPPPQPQAQTPPTTVKPARAGNVPTRPRTPSDLKAARVERVPGSSVPWQPVGPWRQELTCVAEG
jgi:hypothetical protein